MRRYTASKRNRPSMIRDLEHVFRRLYRANHRRALELRSFLSRFSDSSYYAPKIGAHGFRLPQAEPSNMDLSDALDKWTVIAEHAGA